MNFKKPRRPSFNAVVLIYVGRVVATVSKSHLDRGGKVIPGTKPVPKTTSQGLAGNGEKMPLRENKQVSARCERVLTGQIVLYL